MNLEMQETPADKILMALVGGETFSAVSLFSLCELLSLQEYRSERERLISLPLFIEFSNKLFYGLGMRLTLREKLERSDFLIKSLIEKKHVNFVDYLNFLRNGTEYTIAEKLAPTLIVFSHMNFKEVFVLLNSSEGDLWRSFFSDIAQAPTFFKGDGWSEYLKDHPAFYLLINSRKKLIGWDVREIPQNTRPVLDCYSSATEDLTPDALQSRISLMKNMTQSAVLQLNSTFYLGLFYLTVPVMEEESEEFKALLEKQTEFQNCFLREYADLPEQSKMLLRDILLLQGENSFFYQYTHLMSWAAALFRRITNASNPFWNTLTQISTGSTLEAGSIEMKAL